MRMGDEVMDDMAHRRLARTRRSPRFLILLTPLVLLSAVTACDDLLTVDLPGQLAEDDLRDVRLAGTMVNSVQGLYECGLNAWIRQAGSWAGDFYDTGTGRGSWAYSPRLPDVADFMERDCLGAPGTPAYPGTWLPFQQARQMAALTLRFMDDFTVQQLPRKNLFVAQVRAYEGYSYQMLGESFCELAFDGGPKTTREETWRLAEERFTTAIDVAGGITTGPDAAEARSIRNMALVGRARARLNLGNHAGVLADAIRVDEDFVRVATASSEGARRENRIYVWSGEDVVLTVTESYRDLTVDGMPDPRVQVVFVGQGLGADRELPNWNQLKYRSRNAPIPFSTWREAQLMIAEVEGGQTAVDVINRLRATHDLPQFSSSDPAAIQAQVIEERRRELWLQGTRLGDMLRLGLPFPSGAHPRGFTYSDLTCLPTPTQEVLANRNL